MLKIAVVSHGVELFVLTKSNKSSFNKVHSLVEQMHNKNIPVHICGTFASWQQKITADFPDYVDVVEQGPAQIEFYEDLGYRLIVVHK